jgi:hypothetical protein
MAAWSEHWKLPKGQREEALKASRFTPPTSVAKKTKNAPNKQTFSKKDK